MNKYIYLSIVVIVISFNLLNAQTTEPNTEPLVNELQGEINNYIQPEKLNNLDIKKELPTILRDTFWATDPRIVYATFLFGNGYDKLWSSIFDKDKSTIHGGYTGSTNIKVTPNAYQTEKRIEHDCLLAKFDADGKPVFITYFGGDDQESIYDCALDAESNIYVTGFTRSFNFPLTSGEYKGHSDCFVAKFSPDGQLIWSQMIGDTNVDYGFKIVCKDDYLIVAGSTQSDKLPIKGNTYQQEYNDAQDAFIIKMDLDGEIIWSTYFGGNRTETTWGLGVDRFDNIALMGRVESKLPSTGKQYFPVTENAFQKDTSGNADCFLAMFDGYGQLKWSTLYGGNNLDYSYDLTVDNAFNIIFCGTTESKDFPVTITTDRNPVVNPFLVKFDNQGNRIWARTYLGQSSGQFFTLKNNNENDIWTAGILSGDSLQASTDALYGNDVIGGAGNLIISKISSNGNHEWLSYYRFSRSRNWANSIDVYGENEFMISGDCESYQMSVTENAFQHVGENYSGWNGYIIHANLNRTDIEELTDNTGNSRLSILQNTNEIQINSNNGITDIESVEVYDLMGKEVFHRFNINTITYSINLSQLNLTNCLYILKVKSSDNYHIYKIIL